jgi:hypothetical protein
VLGASATSTASTLLRKLCSTFSIKPRPYTDILSKMRHRPKRQSYPSLSIDHTRPLRHNPSSTTGRASVKLHSLKTRLSVAVSIRYLVDLGARGGLLLLLLGGHGRRSGGLLFLHKQRVGKVTAMLVWRLRDTESDANEVAAGKSRRHCAFQRSGIHCARLAEI